MKDKINKIFHTNNWAGKMIFIVLVYIVFWLIFYGCWFLVPQRYFNSNNDLISFLFLFFVFILVPLLSFYIPHLIKKLFLINKIILYSIHVFLMIISLILFVGLSIISALSHFSIG